MQKRFWQMGLICALLTLAVVIHAQDIPQVFAPVETVASEGDGATSAVVWLHPIDVAQSVIVGSDDNEGVGVYALDGSRLQFDDSNGGISQLDIRYNFGSDEITLIAGGVKDINRVMLYTIDIQTRQLVTIGEIETGIPLAGLCLYRSPLTAITYVIALSEGGDFEQYALEEDDNIITASLRRAINIGGEVEACTADDSLRRIYISEGDNAVWRYGAEPEDGIGRSIVDLTGERGHISLEMEGLTLYAVGDNGGYLIITDEKNDSFNVYERTGDNAFIASFGIGANEVSDKVSEPSGVTVVNLPINDLFPSGLFISTDDVNSNPNADNNFKLISWADIATALNLTSDTAFDPRTQGKSNSVQTISTAVTVTAQLETEPVPLTSDSADDPAIWIHPTDTNLSTIIGTDKRNGLVVYGLDGKILQTVNIGRVNNVDLRYNFPIDGGVALVGATNRSTATLVLYAINPETRELYDVSAQPIVSNVEEVYGVCLYISPKTGKYYAFVNSADTGEVEQYELAPTSNNKVSATIVRTFTLGTQTEGCVVDDETGVLYIGEEDLGIWKYGAEPTDGETRTQVDSMTDAGGNLTADVEGLALYYTATGGGYLIASNQGNDEYAVYERSGDNAFVGMFRIIENDTVDATSETDGLDVTNFALGDAFPNGLLVVQDDLNLNPEATQNFKLVDWGVVAQALGLPIDTTFDPRLPIGR
jgi:3-phytase